ncbi:LysE family translocator [Falsiporphyromonas endometrii]|uniref:LysE family translocator n=1 Tax=Falsiporphyromonas endometrii TaxID=1387297 RepID=A0ABV9KAK5_9PORP
MLILILSTIIKAIAIGILVSAPMGPVGILCVKRTLHKGRGEGFMTGIGATISDFVYASITYLGVGFVTSFINDHEDVFTILGSVLLIGFAFYLYRSRTDYNVKDQKEDNNQLNYPKTIASSFLLTFSNPLIIFFFIALYARFNIVPEYTSPILGYLLVMICIIIGALLWWYIVTKLVDKLKDNISVMGLRWFNRIIAIIFALVGLIGIISTCFSLAINVPFR